MKKAIVYIHGKGGSASEAEHYAPLFPGYEVFGFDYTSNTPWEAKREFSEYFEKVLSSYSSVGIIANSIGAYFALCSLGALPLEKAYFISPVVNMEKLICEMLVWAGADEKTLKEKGFIDTSFGETLSWDYLCWVRDNPPVWNIPTKILYGSKDNMQSYEAVKSFAGAAGAELTVMENGEHWFRTQEQMAFLDNWIVK